ncbi:MAG: autotransporter outer membrane beta-barrel domain-containing protein [Rhodobacteraceae bacterium]|nr:autotransporter outer membrane beta-barrel domain-containing protein [Paracoccaceae bacterium]
MSQQSLEPRADGSCSISGNPILVTDDKVDAFTIASLGNLGSEGTYRICTPIRTTGSSSHGLNLQGFVGSNLSVEFTAPITIVGSSSSAIRIESSQEPVESTRLRATDISTDPGDINPAVLVSTPGDIDIGISGHLRTKGDGAFGMMVDQFNPGNISSGDINIAVNDVTVEGDNATGIYVTVIDEGGSDIEVTVGGQVSASGEKSNAIVLEGTNSDIAVTIKPGASVTALSSGSNALAIAGNFGQPPNKSARIANFGTIRGKVLTEGCAFLDNAGRFEMSGTSLISVSPCSDDANRGLSNRGTLTVGKQSTIATAKLSGLTEELPTQLAFTKDGTLLVDVDWDKGEADRLDVVGAVELAGSLELNELSFPDFERANFFDREELGKVSFLSATEGIKGTIKPQDRGLFLTYGVSKAKSDDGELLRLAISTTGVDFLNRNQRSVFLEMQNSLSSSRISQEFNSLLTLDEIPKVRFRLDGFGNEIAGAVLRAAVLGLSQPRPASETCRRELAFADDQGNDSGPFCAAFVAGESRQGVAATDEQRRFDDRELALSAALGSRIGDGPAWWQLTFDGSTPRIGLESLAAASGEMADLGIGGGFNLGPFALSLQARAARGKIRSERYVPIGGGTVTAIADYRLRSSGLSGQIEHRANFGGLGIESFVKLARDRIELPAYEEREAGQFSLDVEGVNESVATKSAGVRLRYVHSLSENTRVEPSVGVAWQRRNKGEFRVVSAFSGGSDEFESHTRLPRTERIISAGIALAVGDTATAELMFDKRTGIGMHSSDRLLRAGLTIRF